jgi:hypothetical protein
LGAYISGGGLIPPQKKFLGTPLNYETLRVFTKLELEMVFLGPGDIKKMNSGL